MKNSHNKKRNVGIIYELLLRHVSARLIEDRSEDAQLGLNIIENYFNENTEIYKEFRLFNALVKSTVSATSVAAAILTEAKGAARRCNFEKLDREKSLLIREINYSLDDKGFYYRRIPDYTTYATIQTLLNEWRRGDRSDLSKLVIYESRVIEWLLKEKKEESIDDHLDHNIDNLVVKILTEKFNKKYTNRLNEEQKDIIKSYVFSMNSDGGRSIKSKLSLIKENTIKQIDELKRTADSQVILEKIDEVRCNIQDIDLEIISDSTISRFLLMSKLKNELVE